MERLQAAIEKARVMRGNAQPDQTSVQQRTPAQAEPVSETTTTVWEALPPLALERSRMAQNRVLTLEPSSQSAPFDLLRTRVLQLCKQNNWRRVAIVSPHAGCGKSTTTLNLAFSLERQKDLRSMVFDCDMRRAGLSRMMAQIPTHDVSDVLTGEVDFARQGQRHGSNVAFSLATAGRVPNPSEILQDQKTAVVLDQIEATYQPNLMLFDMPPLLASDDNFGFLQNVDCALIMVAAEETRMSQIDLAERQVAELTNVLGVVLNKCRHMAHSQHSYEYYDYK